MKLKSIGMGALIGSALCMGVVTESALAFSPERASQYKLTRTNLNEIAVDRDGNVGVAGNFKHSSLVRRWCINPL